MKLIPKLQTAWKPLTFPNTYYMNIDPNAQTDFISPTFIAGATKPAVVEAEALPAYQDQFTGEWYGIGPGGTKVRKPAGFDPTGARVITDPAEFDKLRLLREKQDDLNHTHAFADTVRKGATALVTAPMTGPLMEGAQAATSYATPWIKGALEFGTRPTSTIMKGVSSYIPQVSKAVPYFTALDKTAMGTTGVLGMKDAYEGYNSGKKHWANALAEGALSGAMMSEFTPAVKSISAPLKEMSGQAVEKYFPRVENQIFKLPLKYQQSLYPLRQAINYGIVYPRQNERIARALESMKYDPNLQDKSFVNVNLSNIRDDGFHNNALFFQTTGKKGGLRSIAAVINPGNGVENPTTMKRKLLKAWNTIKRDGDILSGDAAYKQNPIHSLDDLNLNVHDFGQLGLSADSYKLVHDLGKKGNGMVIYSKTPMGYFNPLAQEPNVFNLQKEFYTGRISPKEYATEAEKYFRDRGTMIRQPYIFKRVGESPRVLFQHPSYVEGLRKYMK